MHSVVPRTICETCVGELGPRRDCSCAPRSSAPKASETAQLFQRHLSTAVSRVQRSRVPRSRQLTTGRVGLLRKNVCGMYLVYCLLLLCRVSCTLCVRGRACREWMSGVCCECAGGRVGYVLSALSRLSSACFERVVTLVVCVF